MPPPMFLGTFNLRAVDARKGARMRRDWELRTWWLAGGWPDQLTEEDRRALTPLFWTHVNPYGQFNLQMDRHLDLSLPQAVR